jgi:hypothetical protein
MRTHYAEQKSYFSQIRSDVIDIANHSAEAITKIHELKRAVESGFDDLFAMVAALLVEIWSIQGIIFYSIVIVRTFSPMMQLQVRFECKYQYNLCMHVHRF